MSEVALLPCECGGYAQMRGSRDGDVDWYQCRRCRRESAPKYSQAEAIAAWNTRANPADEVTIPAGMKPWAGGDSAPEDWDGGKVLSRKHGLQHPDRLNNGRWGRERTHPFFLEDEEGCDIIAYTPRANPTPPSLPEGNESGQRSRSGGNPASTDALRSSIIAQADTDASSSTDALREALAKEAQDWRHNAYSRVTFAQLHDRFAALAGRDAS